MKPRKLTENEVRFTVEIEPEDLDHTDGHFDDPMAVEWITKQLDSGHQEAWCCLKVTAKWGHSEGTAYLGGCSYDCGRNPTGAKVAEVFEGVAREHDLYTEALEDLNREIAALFELLSPIAEPDHAR